MIAILVESMKEQQVIIENQAKRLNEFEDRLFDMEFKNNPINKSANEQNGSAGHDNLNMNANAILYQNAPNPFSQNTQIKFYVPENVKTSQLCIYNLQGTQVKQIVITERGESSQWISGSELRAGMYLYALIADGKEIDVKRMILTE